MTKSNIKNPYTTYQQSNNLPSSMSARDSGGHTVGIQVPDPSNYLFGTKSKQYQRDLNLYNHRMAESQFQSQLDLIDEQRAYDEYIYNTYNSPSAQVRQMHNAGLNPDLMGVDSQSFSQSPTTNPFSGVPSMDSSDSYTGFSFIKDLIGVATTASSLVSSIQGFESSSLSNDIKEVELSKALDDMSLKDIVDFYSVQLNGGNGQTSNLSDVASVLSKSFNRRNVRRAYRDSFKRISSRINSISRDSYQLSHDVDKSRVNTLGYRQGDFFSHDDDVLSKLLDPYVDAMVESVHGKHKESSSSSKYSEDTFDSLIKSKSVQRDVVDGLYNSYKSGDKFAGALLLAYRLFMQKFLKSE